MSIIDNQIEKDKLREVELKHTDVALEALEDYLCWYKDGYKHPSESDVEKVQEIESTIEFFKTKADKLWKAVN